MDAAQTRTCMAAILITINLSRSQKDTNVAIRTYQGMTPQLGAGVFVDSSAVVLGDVQLGDDCSVWPLAVIRGDMHHIRIGARSSVQDGSVLHITHAGPFNPDGHPLLIGDEVTIGHKVTLHGCTLGNRILVGMGSIVIIVIFIVIAMAFGSVFGPGGTSTGSHDSTVAAMLPWTVGGFLGLDNSIEGTESIVAFADPAGEPATLLPQCGQGMERSKPSSSAALQ